jgi:lysyl-tRNA synthetase class 2
MKSLITKSRITTISIRNKILKYNNLSTTPQQLQSQSPSTCPPGLPRPELDHYINVPNKSNIQPPLQPITDFSKIQSEIKPGERLLGNSYGKTIHGRIISRVREMSGKLGFFHIESQNTRLQVMLDLNVFVGSSSSNNTQQRKKQFRNYIENLRLGDVISLVAYPGKNKLGEFVAIASDLTILSPCLNILPTGRGDGKDALKDVGIRYRQRELDLLIGGHESRLVFENRAKLIRTLRSYLDEESFIEVETPILSSQAGGAFAKPFQTTSRGGLTLRVAPELYLKRLLIGGFDRVYEIGKVFRDEGVSVRHNPEFTSCEFYEAFTNANDLILRAQDIFKCLSSAIGSMISTTTNIDFNQEFERISIADVLERECVGLKFNNPETLKTEYLRNFFPTTGYDMDKINNLPPPKLLDKLISIRVESKLNPLKPTLLIDHPVITSPLAREQHDRPGITERFELYAGGIELCNAYSELNDPKEQRKRFQMQNEFKNSYDDDEAQPPDEEFCQALELGLPPCAGFGIGIDRVVMILLGKKSIRDVLLFPANYL